MNKKPFLESSFTLGNLPDRQCPTCGIGSLSLAKKDFIYDETKDSIEAHSHPDWDPDWIERRFVGLLRCSKCKEIVCIGGYGRVREYQIGIDLPPEYDEIFHSEYFYPSLNIFLIRNECPKNVAKEIKSAFSLYRSDAASCANKIRVTLELILDDRKVKKTKIVKGERRSISLHERLLEFQEKEGKLGKGNTIEHMIALKWIGNIGSHTGDIEKSDLLQAFELLEYTIEEIYGERSHRLNQMAKVINKAKGLKKKKLT